MTKSIILAKFKNHNFPPNFRNMEAKPDFFISKARLAFTKLRQVFIEAPIFHYFNLKYYIWNETGKSGYAIGRILSQLTLDNLSQWHLRAFFSQKIILAKTRYETHNNKL